MLHQVIFHLRFKKQPWSLQKGQTYWKGPTLIDFILQGTWKTSFLGTSSERLFQSHSDRNSHDVHIVRTSCSQLPVRTGIFCLFVEVVYWPCGINFVEATMNLALQGIIVKLNFLQNFACSFEWVCLQIISDAKYVFLCCPRHYDQGLIIVIVHYFQIWNKKEHNVIISRVISSQMGPSILRQPVLLAIFMLGCLIFISELLVIAFWGGIRNVVANMLHCDIVVSEFEFLLRYYVYFRTNTLKNINSFIPQKWGD